MSDGLGLSGYSGFSGNSTSGYSGFSGNSTSGYSGYSGKIAAGRLYWAATQSLMNSSINTGTASPLTTKGDIYTFDTNNTRLPIGADGTALIADSTQTTGLKYDYPGVGTLRTLKETVFAGITPASYTTGTTTTIDGCGYTCTVAGNGASDLVATGLRLRNGTTSGTAKTRMSIAAGNTGDFNSIVGEARFRRGQFAFWFHMASYNYTNTSGVIAGSVNVSGTYPKWGVSLRQNRNVNGAPNTTTGGIGMSFWWNGTEPSVSSYPGVSTADVWMVFFRTPQVADVYYGTWSSGWPTMESMTLMGNIQMQTSQFVAASGTGPVIASQVNIDFAVEGSAATSGTYEMIFDRWRITTWE